MRESSAKCQLSGEAGNYAMGSDRRTATAIMSETTSLAYSELMALMATIGRTSPKSAQMRDCLSTLKLVVANL